VLADAANHHDPGHFMKTAHAQMAGHTLRRHVATLVARGKTTAAEAMKISNELED
jgi:MSHA biogenesis protein MshE